MILQLMKEKEQIMVKPTKSLTPALMSRHNALISSLGYWHKVNQKQTYMWGKECRFPTPSRLSIMSIHTGPQLEALLDLTSRVKWININHKHIN